ASARNAEGGYELTREEIAMHLCELVMAGIDTTANLIANAVDLLSRHPEQKQMLLDDPALWPAAVEEVLRRRPSTTWMPRLVIKDVEIAGDFIPAGSVVWIALAGLSNDPAQFACPAHLDIHRPNRDQHLAFGKGRHTCMGSP